ncbi:MAG: hypothetical protein AAGI53_08925 [Planctomycetota bacterium]
MKIRLLAAAVLVSSASARLVTFDFPDSSANLIVASVGSDGFSLLIDNPDGSAGPGPDAFTFLAGGLFLHGGSTTDVDLTFSEDVRLVSYEIGRLAFDGAFSLSQGSLVSLGNPTTPRGSIDFSNTSDVFLGGEAIRLETTSPNGEGYSIRSITVFVIPSPASAAPLAVLGLAAARRRR